MEYFILAFIVFGFIGLAIYFKKPKSNPEHQLEEKNAKILALEKELSERNTIITNLNKQLDIAAARTENLDKIRDPIYKKTSDIEVDVSYLSKEDVISSIIDKLKMN